MKKRNKLLALLLSCAMCLSLLPTAALAASDETVESKTIGIYTTTDMHGKVYDQNPVGGTWTDSYLKVATAMKQEREEMDGTILIDNGDLLQGSTIMSYNINIENGENSPAALCLRYCGYDAFVPGNHEFNFTLDIQKEFYALLAKESVEEMPDSRPVPAVCANLLDEETEEVAEPFTPYIIKEFAVGEKIFKIGILGFENMNVPNWDLPSHYEGMIFGHKDNEAQSYAYEWTNYWQKVLKEDEGCDIVIVAVHSGEGSADSYNKENQVAHFIKNTTGIDMVIAGHNHQPGLRTLKNAEGKAVPCVNGGASNLTKTVLTLNSDGTFAFGESSNINLKEQENDAGLKALIQESYNKAVTFVNESIGTLSGDWDDVSDYHTTQSDSYDLVHKAQLWATGADVSLTTPVANRGFTISSLFPEGEETASISLKDCYSLYKYDNNLLYGINMTGKQLKDWLEHCAENYSVRDGHISGGGYGVDIAYGVDYDIYVGEEAGNRVHNLTLADGTPVTDDTQIKVAVSSYRLSAGEGNDQYGWWETTGINVTTEGTVYFDASTSEEFGAVGGSVPLIIGEYIKEVCKDGEPLTPGSETHWTLNAGEAPTPLSIMVMSTTDMHGEVWNKNVLTDEAVTDSFLKVATAVDSIREQYGENTILVDNGDLYQGTTISTYNILNQQGVKNPMTLALRNIGYDAFVLGNHEFNYSWETTQTMYQELKAPDDENGSSVAVLAANLYWRDGEHVGENAFDPYVIKEFTVDGRPFKVGIIGFENTDCDQFDVPANFGIGEDGTGGVTLTPPGNETRDMAVEAEKYVTILREEKDCDFVIVAYHSGVGRGNESKDTELVIGTNTENQIARMIANNTGIDLVIAGHDHGRYSNQTVTDASGAKVPVINGGGSQLARARIDVSCDAEGNFDVKVTDLGNMNLNKLEDDAELTALIRHAAEEATAYVNGEYGQASGEWDGSSDYRMGHNDTIDLINRAQIWTARENGIEMDAAATTDIVSSRYVIQEGPISLKDIYRIYKYDNYLYAVEMTGAQLKDWLEGVAAFYYATVEDGQVRYGVERNFVTALFYGLDFQYDLSKPVGERVVNLARSSTGEAIQADDKLIIGVNNYVIGQDPFVKAMGKDASSTEEKAEIIANALWSSQEKLGDEQGLVTQMVANFVQNETNENGSVTPAPSGWSLAYTQTSDSGSSEDAYPVVVEKSVGGRVKATPTSTVKGSKVTVTVTPDDGYTLVSLTATDKKGNELDLTKVDDGQYTFKMPSSKVVVKAVFSKDGTPVSGLPFTDVNTGAWYYGAVKYVYENGLMDGTSATTFAPTVTTSRAMVAQVLYNLEGNKAAGTASFTDVAANAWYADAVNWAASNGLVKGYGNGKFGPEDSVTREQLAVILYNYAKFKGYDVTDKGDLSGFNDDAMVSGWAKDAMTWAVGSGLISGKNGSLLDPTGTATRAEVAQMLMNFQTAHK